eukprot:1181061-Prorocentrum_minimum.AAC.3
MEQLEVTNVRQLEDLLINDCMYTTTTKVSCPCDRWDSILHLLTILYFGLHVSYDWTITTNAQCRPPVLIPMCYPVLPGYHPGKAGSAATMSGGALG